MIEVEITGRWDGIDADGNSTYGVFYGINNMPELPDTLEGKIEELSYYKEYLDYKKEVLPPYEYVVKEKERLRQIWIELNDEVEKEGNSFVSRIFNHSKLKEFKIKEEKAYFDLQHYDKLIEEYEHYNYVKGLYESTSKEIEDMKVKK